MINAVILGGKSEKLLEGQANKGLIDINGKPMISYVIESIRASNIIDKIVIVGNKSDYTNPSYFNIDGMIEDRGSIIENVRAGVEYFKNDDRVLIATCDIPLITGDGIRDFVEKSLESKGDVCYPIVERSICEARYPETKRTYGNLVEGSFTGGNITLLNPKIIDRCIDVAKKMIEHRKNPIKMSRVLGLPFLIKLILGRLTISAVEKRVEKILKINPKAIICDHPEIGNDVDKPEDIEMVKKYIMGKAI